MAPVDERRYMASEHPLHETWRPAQLAAAAAALEHTAHRLSLYVRFLSPIRSSTAHWDPDHRSHLCYASAYADVRRRSAASNRCHQTDVDGAGQEMHSMIRTRAGM